MRDKIQVSPASKRTKPNRGRRRKRRDEMKSEEEGNGMKCQCRNAKLISKFCANRIVHKAAIVSAVMMKITFLAF